MLENNISDIGLLTPKDVKDIISCWLQKHNDPSYTLAWELLKIRNNLRIDKSQFDYIISEIIKKCFMKVKVIANYLNGLNGEYMIQPTQEQILYVLRNLAMMEFDSEYKLS